MTKVPQTKEADEIKEKVGFQILGVFVNGKCVRSYDSVLHGTRTAEYAESYAKKVKGTVEKIR